MAYTNSSLVSYTKLSPNHSGQRTHSIDRITPHCVVGQLTARASADALPARPERPAVTMASGKTEDRPLRGGEEPLLVFFQQRQRPEGCHHRVRQRFESSLRNDHRCLQFPRETVYGHLQTEWEEETSLAGG